MKVGVVDLFCGVGGLSYGLKMADFNVLAGYDIDSSCKYAIGNLPKIKAGEQCKSDKLHIARSLTLINVKESKPRRKMAAVGKKGNNNANSSHRHRLCWVSRWGLFS